jgi:NADH-quinone oxidoreductase subunit G
MVKVIVDGDEVDVAPGSTVLQACEQAGREIPRFCYHERLSIAGNCRMCLVEVEKAPKPIASCAYPIAEGMVVKTDTPMVRQARRGVMEFLLINHPLDCPICDQGGECDLQDQSFAYGMDHSRYAENKRAVKDKYLGPLVKTVMTRCIQCTRCVRFATEIAGVSELGATARGEDMEIGTYVEKALTSELSGNLIDICPVGALTSKPYAFVARPWELQKTESVDVMDALGTPIRIDARGPEVLRILPRVDDDINEEWLADKARFAFDGLKRRRLDKPWVRRNGRLEAASWSDAFAAIAGKMRGVDGARIGAVAGDLCDAESLLALRDLMTALGSGNLDCRQDGARLDASRREFYTFNSGIAGIDAADAIVLIGSNPRHEAPVLNARLRRRAVAGVPVGLIGRQADLTYDFTHLGDTPAAIEALGGDGDHGFGRALRQAKRPMVIVGQGALCRGDGAAVLAAAWSLADRIGALTQEWHGFNVLHTAAAHHGDRGAARADVILPGCAYTEKNGTYVNTEGRVQRGYRALFAPGEAREDWRILRAFSDVLGKALPYDDMDAVRAHLERANPVFARAGLPRFGATDRTGPAVGEAAMAKTPFMPAITDYYLTNSMTRASQTMAECSRLYAAPVAIAAE